MGDAYKQPKDTVKYHVVVGKEVVLRAIISLPTATTPAAESDWYAREQLHQSEFPGCRLRQIGRRTTREAALKWEREGGRRRYRLPGMTKAGAPRESMDPKRVILTLTGACCLLLGGMFFIMGYWWCVFVFSAGAAITATTSMPYICGHDKRRS